MDFPDLMTSLIFAGICLTASIGVVQLSGFVPASEHKPLESVPGRTPLLIGSALLTLCLTGVALAMAVTDIGWAFAVVIAGIAFLAAPFLVEPLPVGIKDSAAGLALFIAIAAVALGVGVTETWGA